VHIHQLYTRAISVLTTSAYLSKHSQFSVLAFSHSSTSSCGGDVVSQTSRCGFSAANPVMRSVFPEHASAGSAGAPARVMTGTQAEPAELQCDPGTGLHVVGLTPLGGAESNPTPVDFGAGQRCHYLDNVKRRMAAACNGLARCLVDMTSIHATKDKCTGVGFVSIDVFCEPISK
jgi:hypothetical protein